ncbi:hypothetical protein V8F20_009600 [Naviculisporaceae sp. PSN 640]
MARYVNPEICSRYYGINLNCTIDYSDPENKTVSSLGGIGHGGFDGDPDIAGIGVLGAFVTVTIFSVVLSIGNTVWWIMKNVLHWKTRISVEEKADKKWQLSLSGFFETLVLTCSDQQIFTGGAYAITLRYAKACSISAYHYNVVTNMLLFTCATHLMAVTIAKHYWQHPYIAALRIAITSLVYLITGLILSNQNSSGVNFPTKVPDLNDKYSTMLLPAACFQSGEAGLAQDIQNAFNAKDVNTFFSNQIPGFTQYLVMCMFYIVAVFVSTGRFIRRGADHNGKRKRFLEWFKRRFSLLFRARRFFYLLFAIYLMAGVGIAAWTVQAAFRYIYDLRYWVRHSDWQNKDGNGKASEDDPTTFGQLVPMLLISLTVFSFLHLLAERLSVKRRQAKQWEQTHNQKQHSSDGNSKEGKVTQLNSSNDYFGQLPPINADKSSGIGFAVTEFGNVTPSGSTPGVYAQGMQPPQPPHLQSRSQTWASNMTAGTTVTQGSNRSVSYSRPHNGSQTFVGQQQPQHQQPQHQQSQQLQSQQLQPQQPQPQSSQQQQQQQQQSQADIITPAPSTSQFQIIQNPSQTQFQPIYTAQPVAGADGAGYTVYYSTAPPNVDLSNVVPVAPVQTQTQTQATFAASTEAPTQPPATWTVPAGYYTIPLAATSGTSISSLLPPPQNNMNTSEQIGPSPLRQEH